VNGDGILLDSVILIDHLSGVGPATEYLRGIAERAHISAITRAEVLTGFAPENSAILGRFLMRFRSLSSIVRLQTLPPISAALTDGAFPMRSRLPLRATTDLPSRRATLGISLPIGTISSEPPTPSEQRALGEGWRAVPRFGARSGVG